MNRSVMPWVMPWEGVPHERTWVAWPTDGYSLGESSEEIESVRRAWAAVANAVAEFEPVTVIVDPRDVEVAAPYLDEGITLKVTPLNDAWVRDMGPTFVVSQPDAAGKRRLGAVNWIFNGWGAQEWAEWDKDEKVAATVAGWAGAELIDSPIVNEGGGIHVDGEGTVLVTETVQLDPGRNPGKTHGDIEAELRRTLGVSKVIWLPRGLTRDYQEFGTRGHVDIVATFARPGVVLVHDQENPEHPDYGVSQQTVDLLQEQTDAAGRELEIVRVPAPATLRDDRGWVDYSYINHLVVNGGVVACSFNDSNDDRAAEILAQAYPGRRVVTVDARSIFAGGGGIHCITQQQPSV
ncbi:agmatine deiminase family protein [Lysinibacter sp. HNR]|uniref:agmatine deiminase family protein n=1 Tax=Lysinibacter sp. HNR TaxID=3031408 RepID=UPI002435A859|nr:agmatine deiminase family protein [Lysinibacter sp. HNR]WGD36672.1 agmatine deiminase family protein [Lysinibacter sp. HNR]